MDITTLRAKIGTELGLGSWFSTFDGTVTAYSNLPPNDQIRLTNAMKAYIRDHPSEFNAAQISVANTGDIGAVGGYSLLEGIQTFGSELENQALDLGNSVAQVGTGIKSTLNLAGWVIPAGALVVGGILLYAFYKKRV